MYWWNCRVYGQIINYINISQQRYLESHWLQNNKFQLVPSDETKFLIFSKSHVKRLYWTNSHREMYTRYGWSCCVEWPCIVQCNSMVTWLATGGLNSNWEWNLCHWLCQQLKRTSFLYIYQVWHSLSHKLQMCICHLPSLLFEALRRRISFMFTDNDAKKKWDFFS